MQEFIDAMWYWAEVHREDGNPSCESDAAAYIWAAMDATLFYEDGKGIGFHSWVDTRLETLPSGAFEDSTILEIRSHAMEILMGIASGGLG